MAAPFRSRGRVLPAHAKGSWRPRLRRAVGAFAWSCACRLAGGSLGRPWVIRRLSLRGHCAQRLAPLPAPQPGRQSALYRNRVIRLGKPLEGASWQGDVDCFVQKKRRLRCTLLAEWQAGYEHPWGASRICLPPRPISPGMRCRAWIEAGFKDFKRGSWGWRHSLMQAASRVERLWLAMAVALVWTAAVGSQADSQRPVPSPEHVPQRMSSASAGNTLRSSLLPAA